MFYFGLSSPDEITAQDLEEFRAKGLLYEAEVDYLVNYRGERSVLLGLWACCVVDHGLNEDKSTMNLIPLPYKNTVYGRLDTSRKQMVTRCRDVTNLLALPIPFPYYHVCS